MSCLYSIPSVDLCQAGSPYFLELEADDLTDTQVARLRRVPGRLWARQAVLTFPRHDPVAVRAQHLALSYLCTYTRYGSPVLRTADVDSLLVPWQVIKIHAY